MAAEVTKDRAVIENEKIRLEFILRKKRIASVMLTNKLAGETVEYDGASNLFSVCIKGGLLPTVVTSDSVEEVSAANENGTDVLNLNFGKIKAKDAVFNATVKYELKPAEAELKKRLVLAKVSCGEKAVLDYIDFFPVRLQSAVNAECADFNTKGVLIGTQLYLGQPIFASSFFYGCEFPATMNRADGNNLSVRYYSGKSMSVLLSDGSFVSKTCVIGACCGSEDFMRKRSFYDYIDSISKPVRLTFQYNSWYDLKLDISDEKISHSFLEIERAMTKSGADPLYCYAIDDGWNDYDGPFWSFNKNFPNELYGISALTKAFGSSLGLWLGPRGGYTKDTIKFAKNIEKSGNGFFNKHSFDVDVASEKYIKKTADFLCDCIEKFDISYLKLDGFLQKPCRNSNHDHITGGYKDMYEYTQFWERWLDVFTRMNVLTDGMLFINLTSYAPLSPWLLQWVDSVWIQISYDLGFTKRDANGKKLSCSKKDMALTYRDNIYYELFKERGLVFPFGRLYNHDPIYANATDEDITMTDENFTEYLYTMAGRGNAFWELYYSFSMMNDKKWRINSGVMSFLKENHELLSKSQMFGCKPSAGGVYGYAAFGKCDGIVTVRNSSSEPKSYVLRLDEKLGVSKSFVRTQMLVYLPQNSNGSQGAYGYGDTVKLTLAPYQTQILVFGSKVKPLKVSYVGAIDSNTVEVKFNQPVICDGISCVNNKITGSEKLGDNRTVILKTEKAFDSQQTYTLCGVKDLYLRESDCKISFSYYKDNLVPNKTVTGSGEFSVVVTTGGENEAVFFKQGSELELYEANGKVRFRVGDVTVESSGAIHDIVQICAVRERSGVLKLYINKALDTAAKQRSSAIELAGEAPVCFDDGKVKVYNKALDYTQV